MIEQLPSPVQDALDRAIDIGFGVAMRLSRRRYWPAFKAAAADPATTQAELLRRIVAENRGTTFGTEHNFGAIDDARDFRASVPIQDYDTLRTYIETQERDRTTELTTEAPVLYAQKLISPCCVAYGMMQRSVRRKS